MGTFFVMRGWDGDESSIRSCGGAAQNLQDASKELKNIRRLQCTVEAGPTRIARSSSIIVYNELYSPSGRSIILVFVANATVLISLNDYTVDGKRWALNTVGYDKSLFVSERSL